MKNIRGGGGSSRWGSVCIGKLIQIKEQIEEKKIISYLETICVMNPLPTYTCIINNF